MAEPLTSGRVVRDMVADGWELWHVSRDPLPGRWQLRRGHDVCSVSWDAVLRIRRHYLGWFEQNTEELQEGRFTWCYRLRQRRLRLD